jgi:isocitrate dehydrogenase
MMLNHLGETKIASKIQNAWLKTIEDGVHTYDIYKEGISTQKVGTNEFADAIIANLDQLPTKFKVADYQESAGMNLPKYQRKPLKEKTLVGVDLFVHWPGENPDVLAEKIQKINLEHVSLSMITNRGIKVWPEGFSETFCTDHWRCRFKPTNGENLTKEEIIALLTKGEAQGIDIIKTENLYLFDGKQGYSLGQGQ